MAFVLLAAQYTQAERTIDLGTVAVADASHLPFSNTRWPRSTA